MEIGSRDTGGSDALLGEVFAGCYRVRRKLGRGGMGEVYLAEKTTAEGRLVALKLLHRELLADLKMMARFQREARAAARIVHDNVTALIDFGHSELGVPYLAMEYVEGETLSQVIEREGGPLPERRALRVLAQIAAGLAAAHDVGVVHRDLKPSNVMLCAGGDDVVKILDFGLAKILPEASMMLSTVGSVLGTPGYMSPEQLVGDALDARSDLYSFGLLALYLLTARAPYEGASLERVARQLETAPASLQWLPEGTDAVLRGLVEDCLQRSPADRPNDAHAVVSRLRALGAA
ncbi:MAG: serine/threonine protein kinase [Myxococcales bacterium]|nr:serine/threonine protein kinase [Myxococcales bacterium]